MFAQDSLFSSSAQATATPSIENGFPGIRRFELTDGAWLDYSPGWLRGDVTLFEFMAREVDWRQPEVAMYERMVLTPRLTTSLETSVHPVLMEVADALSVRYGERLDRISANWYRNGDDSVAWHGDRVARDLESAIVATVSLRGPREFRYRPRDGGATSRLLLGDGDLVVMGGSFQRTWRHAVPKSATPTPPRMVVMFRHAYT